MKRPFQATMHPLPAIVILGYRKPPQTDCITLFRNELATARRFRKAQLPIELNSGQLCVIYNEGVLALSNSNERFFYLYYKNMTRNRCF